jgi:serine protease AprX
MAATGLVVSAFPAAASTYEPADDMDSMYNTTSYSGAAAWWDAGYTGAGVDVAVIDTGVTPVPGLNGPGKIVYGPDLSLESQAPNLRRLDTNGHGTFMAGLIAGHDSALSAPYSDAPASAYRGMAPDARIVSVKVGVADGGVDVSQVIAAINWVIQHRYDNGMNIRVLNLSYGTNSLQDYVLDPLAYAAEQAWDKGIVVVASGGNTGFQGDRNAPALADPAYDPYLLAVGSSDSNKTATMTDDYVPSFSPWPKRGATRGVDLVAPGAHLQGLRVPGSYVDVNHPEGAIGDRYFRGSGTSESAALVSGAAALVLQRYPDATPDQVKRLLRSTGYLIDGKSQAMGGGELRLQRALSTPLPSWTQTGMIPATGLGSLEASRGSDHISDDGVELRGEIDIFGHSYVSAAMAAGMAAGNTWSGGVWNGNTWSGNTWSGNTWSGNTWSGNTWSGNTWSGNTWSGNTWSGNTWSGNTWSGNSWSGNTWSGNTWSGEAWQGATWG